MPFDESIFKDHGGGEDPDFEEMVKLAEHALNFLDFACVDRKVSPFMTGLVLVLIMSDQMRYVSEKDEHGPDSSAMVEIFRATLEAAKNNLPRPDKKKS